MDTTVCTVRTFQAFLEARYARLKESIKLGVSVRVITEVLVHHHLRGWEGDSQRRRSTTATAEQRLFVDLNRGYRGAG
jgi:hypothetical protein